ncbi:MAG: hypothetical protein CVU39_21045 [Chloroflexi bacterium HGW-Chloroflexi-10]|nr:MAG: hypothetical protein CVU39_21045 [Chloroflexi bacterium HGW-Chloroflexi-10]
MSPRKPKNSPVVSGELPVGVLRLAGRLNLNPQALLDWKVYPGGRVVLIAPNGMKFSAIEVNDEQSDRPAE